MSGPKPKVSPEERVALVEAFKKHIGRGVSGKLKFYEEHARRLNVHALTIRRIVKDGTKPMTLEQKMELRRAFKALPNRWGEKMRFYHEQAERLGFHWNAIRTAVVG